MLYSKKAAERRLNWRLELLQITHAKDPKELQSHYRGQLHKIGSRSPKAGGMKWGTLKKMLGKLEVVHVKEHKRHAD